MFTKYIKSVPQYYRKFESVKVYYKIQNKFLRETMIHSAYLWENSFILAIHTVQFATTKYAKSVPQKLNIGIHNSSSQNINIFFA